MKTKFDIHEKVYCVYCGDIYKADILSVNIDSNGETYEVQLINYSNPSCLCNDKILECEEDEIFSTRGEVLSAIVKEQEKYIYNIKSNYVKRYKEPL